MAVRLLNQAQSVSLVVRRYSARDGEAATAALVIDADEKAAQSGLGVYVRVSNDKFLGYGLLGGP